MQTRLQQTSPAARHPRHVHQPAPGQPLAPASARDPQLTNTFLAITASRAADAFISNVIQGTSDALPSSYLLLAISGDWPLLNDSSLDLGAGAFTSTNSSVMQNQPEGQSNFTATSQGDRNAREWRYIFDTEVPPPSYPSYAV